MLLFVKHLEQESEASSLRDMPTGGSAYHVAQRRVAGSESSTALSPAPVGWRELIRAVEDSDPATRPF